MIINPILFKDIYKVGHVHQYPKGTTLVFNNFTPRKSKLEGVNHSVFFGLKYFIEGYLKGSFHNFFHESPNNYPSLMKRLLGSNDDFSHIQKLKDLGYLPIEIYALDEGSVVPCGVPALVIYNTHPDFYWLPGMLETLMSCTLWGACTSATISREYRLLLDKYAGLTSDIPEFVDYQAHDFSMRGMFGLEAGVISGMGHLKYFSGTDNIPAVLMYENLYNKPLGICSVPATEHSVMSAGGKENESQTFRRLITKIYPTGIVSIVSDTWNLWQVIGNILPALREVILKRDGKVVIRPDSGDPVEILCGHERESRGIEGFFAKKGLIECLWDIFGGTINSKGFKQLDGHIGAIYGDSITLKRATQICECLMAKGFSSTNVVFGIGSFTYQYNTRDTLGWAMKSTYCEINGEGRAITKDPITDDGTKKSHSGILRVVKVNGAHGYSYEVLQNQTWDQFHQEDNELKLVYEGKIS